MCFCEDENFISGNFYVEIAFATYQVDLSLNVEFSDLVQPVREILEGFPVIEAEAEADSVRV